MASLVQTIDQISGSENEEQISFRKIIDRFESRGFGPLLVVPALVSILPTAVIPGVPALCGIFTLIISIQIFFGRDSPWLPSWLAERSISQDKLQAAMEKARPWVEKVDHFSKPRWELLTGETGAKIVALVCCGLAVLLVPLEMIPFGCAVPATAMLIFAFGLTLNDGLFILAGLVIAALSLLLTLTLVF